MRFSKTLNLSVSSFVLLLAGCGSGSGKESHSNAVDTVNYDICNEDGTINDLSTSTVAEPEPETIAEVPLVDDTPIVEESPQVEPTASIPESTGTGLVPNTLVKTAILPLSQAEECAENKDCRILATDGVKASVEHCGNVTIVVVPR